MRYAIVKNGMVENVIEIHPMNAAEFPTAVQSDIASIGDEYIDGAFYRDGEEVKAPHTILLAEIADLTQAVEILMGGREGEAVALDPRSASLTHTERAQMHVEAIQSAATLVLDDAAKKQ